MPNDDVFLCIENGHFGQADSLGSCYLRNLDNYLVDAGVAYISIGYYLRLGQCLFSLVGRTGRAKDIAPVFAQRCAIDCDVPQMGPLAFSVFFEKVHSSQLEYATMLTTRQRSF